MAFFKVKKRSGKNGLLREERGGEGWRRKRRALKSEKAGGRWRGKRGIGKRERERSREEIIYP